jgi:cell division protein FtsZ
MDENGIINMQAEERPSILQEEVITGFNISKEIPSIIKAIGIGGGGGNAVTHMYKEGIHDVTFALCNTDRQALLNSDIPVKVQLGGNGLGAGNKPIVAKRAAEESIDVIKKLLSDETKMVFITAGMGGGTGTGAAPIVAKVAKEMDILTVGIVTIPFVFEGMKKIIQALDGVEEMSKNVDALLVINNECLNEIYLDLSLEDAFKKADDVLTIAAKSIAEIITVPGFINVDFADVETTLKAGGVAIMGSGLGKGENRLSAAIENSLNSPLLNNNDVFRAKKILLNFSYSKNRPLMVAEIMAEVNDFMAKFNRDIDLIWGTAVDESLGENVKVTILANGFDIEDIPMMTEKLEAEREQKTIDVAALIKKYYGKEGLTHIMGGQPRPKPYIFEADELDNDEIIDIVIKHPSYNRKANVIRKVRAQAIAKRSPNFDENEVVEESVETILF